MTLEGRRSIGGHWQFRRTINEAALYDILGEDSPPPVDAPWVSSWDEALALINEHPWPRLSPIAVHPEFRDAVFAALADHEEGGPDQVERWRDRLGY
jgi:hypothetical protein